MTRYAVIMAGGVGTRFWPVSRIDKPKQFLDILGMGESLLQMTYKRFCKILPEEHIYVVTNESYRDLIKEQIPGISNDQILGEPSAKNTATCIAYACSKIAFKDPNAVVVVAPSDHLILDTEAFLHQVKEGLHFAEHNQALVTLGIKPTRPDTGYGYIQYLDKHDDSAVFKVKTFTEKPNDELARQFIDSGDFLWNAGIFIWKTQVILDALEEFLPDISDLFKQGKDYFFTDKEKAFINKIYPVCPSISIDYGIIEKAENVYVLPSEFGWSDLGTWKSLYEITEKQQDENVLIGDEIELHESSGNLVYTECPKKIVVLEGVNNMFVLDTEDALLVCPVEKEQEVKRIVGELKLKYKGSYI